MIAKIAIIALIARIAMLALIAIILGLGLFISVKSNLTNDRAEKKYTNI